jgi:PAS domain S-box-containing protein
MTLHALRTPARYGTAVVAVGLVLVLKLLIPPLAQTPFPLFLGAVLVAAGVGGVGPGLLATGLALVLADYFFLEPLHTWPSFNEGQAFRLLQFAVEGVFISVVSGLRRHYSHLLHRRVEELHVTLRSIADAVITTDARGAVDFLNPVAETLTGWSATAAAGEPLEGVLHLIDEDTRRPVEAPVAAVIRTGHPATLDDRVRLVARDGGERPVDGSAAPITGADGALLGVVLALHDAAARRQAEEIRRAGLLSRLATIQEDERRRIARELHDETGQQLTALILGLKALRGRAEAAALDGKLAALQDLAEQIGRSAHGMAWELRPTALDDLGLETALRDSVERWSERSGLPADFHCAIGPARLPAEVETHLYRITGEALTNVARHARASRASVILERRRDHLLAIVEDDGAGFDPEAVRRSASSEHRLGLYGMQERAALVGGTLQVESSPGHGTTVFVRVPFNGPAEANGE